jgi:glucosylceramidase
MTNDIRVITCVLCSLLSGLAAYAQSVSVHLTRGDQISLLEERPALTFAPGSGSHSTKIYLDPATRYQVMDGFGAALTDSSAWLIQNELSPSQREALLDQLFSRDGDGIGLNMIRIPMGASDFALAPYTYNDLPSGQSDPMLSQFSIASDLVDIVPTLQAIASRNAEMRLIGTPWSPPAWMKNSGTLFGGSFNTAWYATYAQYFVKFVQSYQSFGLPIFAVTPQNEPLNDSSGLPSMSMPTFVQSAFVGDHLGPAIASAGLNTKIWVYDHNWDEWNYPLVVMNDPEVNVYAHGAAFHGYAGEVSNQSLLHDFRPDIEIHFTEITGGDWATNWADNLVWSMRHIVIGAPRNWAQSVLMWNVALDQNSGPYIPGGCEGCRGVVTIDTSNGNVTYEVEYYTLAHASRFVLPGAQRIGSDSIENAIETVAYRNPDCSEVLIALNPSGSSRWFDLVRDGEYVSLRLTGRSVATLVWTPEVLAADLDADGDVNSDDALMLMECIHGPEVSADASACLIERCGRDVDGDLDLDLNDIATVQWSIES